MGQTDWLEQERQRKYHPISNIFPLMIGTDFETFKADIAKNGLREPIWLHSDGSILDGRNRHRACMETETLPVFHTWNGGGSPVAFVVSMNLHRRHLDESQRAMCAARLANMPEGRPEITAPIGAVSQPEAATLLNASRRSVQRAAKVQQDGIPDLADAVDAGKVAVSLAANVTKLPKEQQQEFVQMVDEGVKPKQAKRKVERKHLAERPLPKDKYRVFYADPPWKYGDSGNDNYGPAERHYPAMSIDELCALEVKKLAQDDAVLFLWVTSPMLDVCFKVIKAWGFKYKTSFVWDKVKHNFGHYNSVRHELLLVCTRGSCTPDSDEKVDSVQTIERSNEHSEKPEEFRQIIDTLYTHGKRIELFARTKAEGWETWGNEPEIV